jgi:hypothetical protein
MNGGLEKAGARVAAGCSMDGDRAPVQVFPGPPICQDPF